MDVIFSRRTVAGVPLLLATAGGGAAGGPLPLVLWCHGFRASSDDHRGELARVASAGFLAAGLDAVDHGERLAPDLAARIAAAPGGALEVVLDLAERTAAEIPGVVRALVDERWAAPGGAALVGISMGGYLAYRAALVEPALRTVVALLGSPEWPGAANSPHRTPEAFHGVALLSVTAGRDESVPPDAARRFHAALAAGHPRPERARYLEIPDAPHLMNGAQWSLLMDATLDWLRRHAGPVGGG